MPLLSANASSNSGLHISLHPLVLLTISDYITRHALRNGPGVIVGALLGQHTGRHITLEHAYECQTLTPETPSDDILLDEEWFGQRLEQYRDVHKAPVLDLVGWFTTAPQTGPEAVHIPIHQQILRTFNDGAVMLCIHPQTVLEGARVGGQLPLTVYESVYESKDGAEKGSMDIDGQDLEDSSLEIRFRELPYSIETGEAEMIGVDFVARGGGNATAIDGPVSNSSKDSTAQAEAAKADTKGKAVTREAEAVEDVSVLSAEDEELISSLTARINAVKMLHTRISLLKSYLTSLPPSYLTNPALDSNGTTNGNDSNNHTHPATISVTKQSPSTTAPTTELNHPLLRSISSLLARLPLLTPPTPDSLAEYKSQSAAEKSDVQLVSLLGSLGRSVKDTKEMGRKFSIVESGRSVSKKNALMAGNSAGGGGGGGVSGASGASSGGGGGRRGNAGGGGGGAGGIIGDDIADGAQLGNGFGGGMSGATGRSIDDFATQSKSNFW